MNKNTIHRLRFLKQAISDETAALHQAGDRLRLKDEEGRPITDTDWEGYFLHIRQLQASFDELERIVTLAREGKEEGA